MEHPVVIESDPRTWCTIPKAQTRRGPRHMGGVWITGEYVGISDDAYTYLKNPEYIRLVQNNSNLALMPCSKTDDEALKVHGDTIALNFWHVWIPAQHCRLFKRGRHPGSVYKRAVGSDVYILLEDAHAT